jgi:hypothetical protein
MEFIYTHRYKKIEIKPTDKICLWMFSDVHRDTPQCDVERWKWFLQRAKKSHDEFDHVFYFILGDTHDFVSFSEQKKLTSNNLHKTTIDKLDLSVQTDIRKFASEISFMKGHILGIIEGNHSWTYVNGETSTQDLAKRMDTEYLGWLSYFRLAAEFKNKESRKTVDFCLCHGKAGGKTAGITITQVDDLRRIFPVADVFCMGHDHQRGAIPQSVLIPTHGGNGQFNMKQQRQFLCRSGSFKRAYMNDTSGYEIGRLFKPSDLGALQLVIQFHRDRRNNEDQIKLDIEARI